MIVGKELNNCFPDHVVLIRLNELLHRLRMVADERADNKGRLEIQADGMHGGFRLFMKDKLKARVNPLPPLGTAEQQQDKGEKKKSQKMAACRRKQGSGEVAT